MRRADSSAFWGQGCSHILFVISSFKPPFLISGGKPNLKMMMFPGLPLEGSNNAIPLPLYHASTKKDQDSILRKVRHWQGP